jgi:hypothetical protein
MDPGPRKPGQVEQQTGTGTSRSADDGLQEDGALAGNAPDVTAAAMGGRQSTSHPAESDELNINRSGSGGSGGATTEGEEQEGSTPASMEELLTGEDDGSTTAG